MRQPRRPILLNTFVIFPLLQRSICASHVNVVRGIEGTEQFDGRRPAASCVFGLVARHDRYFVGNGSDFNGAHALST
jgi:hypothetical protein